MKNEIKNEVRNDLALDISDEIFQGIQNKMRDFQEIHELSITENIIIALTLKHQIIITLTTMMKVAGLDANEELAFLLKIAEKESEEIGYKKVDKFLKKNSQ